MAAKPPACRDGVTSCRDVRYNEGSALGKSVPSPKPKGLVQRSTRSQRATLSKPYRLGNMGIHLPRALPWAMMSRPFRPVDENGDENG